VPTPKSALKYERTSELISTGYYKEIFLKGVQLLAEHRLLTEQGAYTLQAGTLPNAFASIRFNLPHFNTLSNVALKYSHPFDIVLVQ
jgi:hypothetical protein